ncbi:MAG: peptidoglycan glycosyltransferase, partial [Lachnospiraceae bacterium]|nr:peptidoglycan glycosyltransferase [Lachnospiraceae bacterium]
MKQKLALLFVFVVLILLGIIVRLVYINRVSGDQYTKRVLSQQDTSSTTLPYQRGDIYDRNGTVLATSEKKYNVILDPGVLWEYYDEDAEEDYVEPTLQALVDCFGLDRSELNTIMEEKKSSHYVVLAKELSK